ncbi:MAG: hypothetical protein FJY10_02185 [Bacteroidetes bacterium]|nr:hypothetical protein [Bacteroidota bacterium]
MKQDTQQNNRSSISVLPKPGEKWGLVFLLVLFLGSSYGQEVPVTPTYYKTGIFLGVSQPLRDIPPLSQQQMDELDRLDLEKPPRNPGLQYRSFPFAATAQPTGPDPVWQDKMGITEGAKTTIENWNGSQSGSNPPDPCGDVGPNHYIQAYNSRYVVYNKTGTILAGPTNLNLVFGGVPGSGCNDGDPIILYDEQADRWLIIEFSLCGANDYVLVAVSQTADPTGSYYGYSFDTDDKPDYEKVAVWRDGYYMGTNTGGLSGTTDDIYVMERDVMLAGGASPQLIGFNNPNRPASSQSSSSFMCVPPVDNDGTFAPAGYPGLFIAFNDDAVGGGSDQLWIYQLSVNWTTPGSSTFNRTQQINVAAFDSNFGTGWDNIEQPGTTQELDGIPIIIMNAPQYRNFGTYQTLVCCHTVDVDNTDRAGIRWYELRRTSGNWTIRQQGTYSPNATDRWMGSVRMNGHGEIGLGYSVSSGTVYPGIRYTGQDVIENSKASGLMNISETTISTGSYSQTGSERWGDYTSLNVDPTDDRTFWYTNMHVLSNNATKQTVIASFSVFPASIYVDLNAAAGGNGTIGSPIKTVTLANQAAGPNTNVYVRVGTYDESNPILIHEDGMWRNYDGNAIIK